MSTVVKNIRGEEIKLLNPYEKGTKMFNELQKNVHLTNDNLVKVNKSGKPRRLSDTQRAFRSGYLTAQKDARKAFRAKNPDYKAKTEL